jgi:hypothetical protein
LYDIVNTFGVVSKTISLFSRLKIAVKNSK